MTSCSGDSGGSVWAEQNDGNDILAGIYHGRTGGTFFTKTIEGGTYGCASGGSKYYTGISSLLALGLSAPVQMS